MTYLVEYEISRTMVETLVLEKEIFVPTNRDTETEAVSRVIVASYAFLTSKHVEQMLDSQADRAVLSTPAIRIMNVRKIETLPDPQL